LLTAKGKPVTPQTFQKILENPIYAGWIAIPEWEIMERGSFQPLVSQELFDQVRDVLAGKKPILTGYQRNHPHFPLRLFVRCARCKEPLTASSSSNGKQPKRYPYYRCRRNCGQVKAKRDDLHTRFMDWLDQLTPEPDSIEEIKATIRTVWKERQGDAAALRSVLNRKLDKAANRKKTLVTRWLDDELDKATYNEHLAMLSTEIEEIRSEIRNTEFEQIELEAVLTFADQLIKRPAKLWVESNLDQKQRLQKTLFPYGITFDGERFGTDATPLFFNLLDQDLREESCLASPTGFEPVLSP